LKVNARPLESAQAALAAAGAAETQARERWREAQRLTDAAREDHAVAEREISRNAARISALKEAQQRTSAGHQEALAAHQEAQQALAALPSTTDLEARLAEINEVIARDRSALAEVRVEAQGITRETELANRRLQAIAEERQGWNERKDSASAQIATIEQRTEAATGERTELLNAPQKFAGQRQALIGEIDTATAGRRTAADRAGSGRERPCRSRQGRARRARSRRRSPRRSRARRGTLRVRQAPPRRYRTRNPRPAANRAGCDGRTGRA
jgi:chromosome segregation protein